MAPCSTKCVLQSGSRCEVLRRPVEWVLIVGRILGNGKSTWIVALLGLFAVTLGYVLSGQNTRRPPTIAAGAAGAIPSRERR
jgi:hypothetical protein